MKRAFCFFAVWLALLSSVRADSSPQHYLFEIKFGPYSPQVGDSIALHGSTTYSDVFGDSASAKGARPPVGLLSQFEFDYQFLHRFGILGVGLSAGYHTRSARQFAQHPTRNDYCEVRDNGEGGRRYVYAAQPDKGLPEQESSYADCTSGAEDILSVVPLSLLLTYRFDVLSTRYRIPLIPYMKVGLVYSFWWLGNTDETVTTVKIRDTEEWDKAQGGVFGLGLHPGIALNLSALDPSAARAIDQEIGLNRVTAFAELNYLWVNGFGRANKLDLSDLSVSAGLAFEF